MYISDESVLQQDTSTHLLTFLTLKECPSPVLPIQQVGDDVMSLRQRQRCDCERAQEALSRVTSCFQQLAASLGSSADCSFLRDEMDETRALAYQLCSGNRSPASSCPIPVVLQVCLSPVRLSAGSSKRLMHLLSECDSAPSGAEDRQVLERLWVLFLSALENFLFDLRKAGYLIERFPLNQHYDRRSLVNTGQLIPFQSGSSVIG